MKNGLFFIGLSLLILQCFYSCRKKIFGHVEVKGRVIDFLTQQGMPLKISVSWEDSSASFTSRQKKSLATTTAGEDGTFGLRFKTMRRGKYFLYVEGVLFRYQITVKNNAVTDVGNILGQHTIRCKINLISRSDSSVSIDKGAGQYAFFEKGLNTQLEVDSIIWPWLPPSSPINKYHVKYYTTCCAPQYNQKSVGYTKTININDLTEVLETTIYY